MKNYRCFLLFVSVLLISCQNYSGDMIQTDWDKLNFNGEIKSYIEIVTTVDDEGVEEVISSNVWVFNRKGYLIEEDYVDLRANEQSSFFIYKHDNFGNILKKTEYDADGKVYSRWNYKYDSAGYLTMTERHNEKGKREYRYCYEYDSEGNKINADFYVKWGKIISSTEYEYAQNMLISEKDYNSAGELMEAIVYTYEGTNIIMKESLIGEYVYDTVIYSHVYDSDGNKTEWAEFNADGEQIYKNVYDYDVAGNRITELHYEGDLLTYEYGYDSFGNFTTFIHYDTDGDFIFRSISEYSDDGRILSGVYEDYLIYNEREVYPLNFTEYFYSDDGNLLKADYYRSDSIDNRDALTLYQKKDCIIQYY